MNPAPSVNFSELFHKAAFRRSAIFGTILLVALLAFEMFNYSTTDFALSDLFGNDLRFMGIRWAAILSIAFCGIDFAGIARLFTPEQGAEEPKEVWYLFGAWMLAAAMNAILTWWGVAVAVRTHSIAGSAVLGNEALLNVVPVFVAAIVWVTRILLIGTFSIAGDRLFRMAEEHASAAVVRRPAAQPRPSVRPQPHTPAPRPAPVSRPEPSYHPVGMSAAPSSEDRHRPWR